MSQSRFRRLHGIGNIIMLLPVLRRLAETSGGRVVLETREEWAHALSALVPAIEFTDSREPGALDLDEMTRGMSPSAHRTDEFARLLGVEGPFRPEVFSVPAPWREKYRKYTGSVILAPEAGHDARQWPVEYLEKLALQLTGEPLVIIGLDRCPDLRSDFDLRGELSIEDLVGLLSVGRALIAMDSGALHLAMSVELPAVAIFSGIDPDFRIRPSQRVNVLQADMDCSPCNKEETCNGLYPCLARIGPELVVRKLRELDGLNGREITRV